MALKLFNSKLKFVKPDWKGNVLNSKGLYANLYGDDIKKFSDFWRWMSNPRPLTKLKKGQESPLSWKPVSHINDKSTNGIIPIGHACFIIDLNNIRILIDPVIAHNRFLKRYTEVPFKLKELDNVDYLLLSHNHRDHIDKNSIIQLCRYNPEAVILTGLEIGKILQRWGIKNEIQEAGWYQQYKTSDTLAIDYLPSQHWSRRWITDTNLNLWGSFMIQDKVSGKKIYFAGDSGYGPHFRDIGTDYNIDLALIGIGACEPQWFMKSSHTGPSDALQAFKDLKAKKWMPMHYGTFDLSDEPVFYPEKVLREQYPQAADQIVWMQIGEKIILV
ncbi:MBL fold metallo-hydrolase [Flavobacterium sp. FlaQc-47]|uniref:MBL fold metallo-hydrolase n=1 Tax=Flavobacterium sp. FlaQc-47 TaxID=3374180 RepID=UPI00375706CB